MIFMDNQVLRQNGAMTVCFAVFALGSLALIATPCVGTWETIYWKRFGKKGPGGQPMKMTRMQSTVVRGIAIAVGR
jgi:hypothetical protein